METITMSAHGFTRTLPAIITTALWHGWEGNHEEYFRRVDELIRMNHMFETLRIPVRIRFNYEVNIDDGEHQPYTPIAVRIGAGTDGECGEEINVYDAALEQWYAQHPEEHPEPRQECTEAEIEATAAKFRRLLGWDEGDGA